MGRFRLTIEYEGTRYSGWQIQKGGRTIQGEILDACRDLFDTSEIDLYGAGRTDSGVHALGQVAHLGVDTELDPLRIRYGINDRLPHDISVIDAEVATPSFHARKDAVARSYTYHISRRRTAFGKRYVWWIKDQLDLAKMNEAAGCFRGLRDFRSFTDDEAETSSSRMEVFHTAVHEFGDILVFHVIGNRFLWKQVRRMTGVLAEVGRGKLSVHQIASFFNKKSDIPAKLTAPPSGLFLDRVYYSMDEISYEPRPAVNIYNRI